MTIVDHLIKKMHLSPTREKIIGNLFWAVLGKLVTLLGGLFVGILIARYLGPKQYGLMNYVISYVFLFQVFSTFGLDSIEVREEAKGDIPYTQIIGTAFVIRLSMALVVIALTIATAFYFTSDTETIVLIAIYSFSILCNTFTVIRNYFLAIVQNEYVVKSEILRTLVGICIKLTLLWFHAPLLWFVAASAFDFCLLSGGYITSYRTQVGRLRDWSFDSAYARFLLREGFPLLLTNASVIIYQRIDQVMIGSMIDKTSVGYFSTAAKFVEILIFVPMMLSQTISPVLVAIRKEDEKAYRQKAQLFMNTSFWLSMLLAAMLSALAYWVVLCTFGSKYLPAVAVLQVLAFKAPSVALSSAAGSMLVIEGLQRWAILRDAFGCLVCIVLNYLLLPRFGIMAAAAVAIMSNIAAGYVADAFIPAFRHIFVQQTRTLIWGWSDLIHFKQLFKKTTAP